MAIKFRYIFFVNTLKLPVGLIQNKVCTTSKVGLSHLQDVDESARCCNNDLTTVLQVPNLSAFRSTSEDTSAAQKCE
jgi:hypothetical protein